MKRILFLINTLSGGGAEKVLIDTANSLSEKMYDVTVQTVFDIGVFKNNLSERVKYKSIIQCKNKLFRRILSKVLFSFLGVRFVYNKFVCAGYDYEIAYLEGLPTKIISKSTNSRGKKYAWVHTDLEANPNSFHAFGSEAKEGAAYRCFDKIFCVSNSVRDAFIRKYGIVDNVMTVYNIIDEEAIAVASQAVSDFTIDIHPAFISVGSLTKPKGYARLLRVHKRLVEEGYLHTLYIVGDGELRKSLESYIKDNNLDQTVFLLGFQPNPYKFIKKCDLFICSSVAEGYSTVVSESVLCGTPVLSTDVAGAKEPVEHPRCSIIVDNSEEALYGGIKNVLEHPEKLKLYQDDLKEIQTYLKKDFLISEFERKVLACL